MKFLPACGCPSSVCTRIYTHTVPPKTDNNLFLVFFSEPGGVHAFLPLKGGMSTWVTHSRSHSSNDGQLIQRNPGLVTSTTSSRLVHDKTSPGFGLAVTRLPCQWSPSVEDVVMIRKSHSSMRHRLHTAHIGRIRLYPSAGIT